MPFRAHYDWLTSARLFIFHYWQIIWVAFPPFREFSAGLSIWWSVVCWSQPRGQVGMYRPLFGKLCTHRYSCKYPFRTNPRKWMKAKAVAVYFWLFTADGGIFIAINFPPQLLFVAPEAFFAMLFPPPKSFPRRYRLPVNSVKLNSISLLSYRSIAIPNEQSVTELSQSIRIILMNCTRLSSQFRNYCHFAAGESELSSLPA